MDDGFKKHKMLKEVNQKELKMLKLTEEYVATDMTRRPLTEKFYSKYLLEGLVDPVKVQENKKKIAYDVGLGPREKYPEPVLESHCIGWYLKPLIPIDRNDKRFYRPIVISDFVKIQSTDKAPPKTFVGIPFKLR